MKSDEKQEFTSFIKCDDGSIIEMVYKPETLQSGFVSYRNGVLVKIGSHSQNGITYLPIPGDNNLLKTKAILFPSDAIAYESDELLIEEIKSFIHRYVGVSSFFEEVATHYVLFTYIYDCFQELPYLRALADYGCGKTRFLKAIGSLCYKPIFTAGATTTSPIFRMIDAYGGTLVLDEADMERSDTKTEMVKILNSGFSKGTPVMRSEEIKGKGYDVKTYNVFCPKIIATRGRFYDKALESRFLIEELDSLNYRDDIPLNLPNTFEEEALVIRNKLLMWRFKNYGPKIVSNDCFDKTLEPRLKQIILPLLSIISNEDLRMRFKEFILEHNKELKQDRAFTLEADILEVIVMLSLVAPDITMQAIANECNIKLGSYDRTITAKRVGRLVREQLKLKPIRTRDGYKINTIECRDKIERLCVKYDINTFNNELVNLVNVPQDGEIIVEDLFK